MRHHTLISTLSALLTLAACDLAVKNLGTPDTTGEASETSSEDSDSTTGTATTATTTAGTTVDTSTSSATTTADSGDTTVGTSTGGPDPDYLRECQPGDFICDDWGCETGKDVVLGQCYKRCTPDEIGGIDAECDEPERPFCSQIGRAFGGDFNCNGCAHICVSIPTNQCDYPVDACG